MVKNHLRRLSHHDGDPRASSVVSLLYYSVSNTHTVLDTDNLHFSNEFLDFPVRTDADIHADVLGLSESHYRLIDESMAVNDERTAADLKKLLSEKFGEENVTYSERTIARARNELGWTFTTASYCQAIQDANKENRVLWVNK